MPWVFIISIEMYSWTFKLRTAPRAGAAVRRVAMRREEYIVVFCRFGVRSWLATGYSVTMMCVELVGECSRIENQEWNACICSVGDGSSCMYLVHTSRRKIPTSPQGYTNNQQLSLWYLFSRDANPHRKQLLFADGSATVRLANCELNTPWGTLKIFNTCTTGSRSICIRQKTDRK